MVSLSADALERLRKDRGPNCSISVLDLCCGKGGDLLKWKKGTISRLICAGNFITWFYPVHFDAWMFVCLLTF